LETYIVDKELALIILNTALGKGADDAEVYVKESRNISIEAKDMSVDAIETSASVGYSVRVIKNGRHGFSYSTNPDEYVGVAEKAVEAASYCEFDPYLRLAAIGKPHEVAVYDPKIPAVTEKEAIQNALLIEESARKDRRIKKIRKASAGFSSSNTIIANSNGVEASYKTTSCSAHIMAIAEEGLESQMGWDFQASRFLNGVNFEEVGKIAAKRAYMLLGAKKISSIKGLVILDNSVASEFLGILSSALSAEAVQKKKSMFAGKIGEMVINSKLRIIDNGILDGVIGSKPVDDEGVPSSKKILIENGMLQGFMHNTYTAAKDNIASTGNAVRGGFTGIPTVGTTNFYLESASSDYISNFDGLMKNADKCLYVIETMGMHTANPITGDFSVGAAGLWIENGEIQFPVKEAVIGGNILNLFKNIAMVGDDLRFYGNIGSPSLLIEAVDISG
jgi:PmbA protein